LLKYEGLTSKSDKFIKSDKQTKIGVNERISFGSNQSNFHLYRSIMSEKIAEVLGRATFSTHTIHTVLMKVSCLTYYHNQMVCEFIV